nr:hypothetical protein [Portibacter lacus]
MTQNIPRPREMDLPNFVSTSSLAEVKHSRPIRKTVSAIKKVCTIIICRFIKLNDWRFSFQLKYLGNTT